MSAPNSLRCLARPSTSLTLSFSGLRIAPFSTTAVHAASPMTKKNASREPAAPYRAGKKLQISKFKKKKVIERGKAPLPGERKAYRKKIVLSNDNALPVKGLKEMGADTLQNSENIGKIVALPESLQDQLRITETFQPTQSWKMFRKPSVLVRKETVELVNKMDSAAGSKSTLRLVLTGDKISGKSLLLLQAQAHAYLNNWMVIHVPDAQELTTACTEYAPIPDTKPVQYMQQNYVLKLLQSIKKANEKILAKITTVSSHVDLPQNIQINSPLLALINAAKEPEGAWSVFRALWQELTVQNANRPPILFTLDGLAHIMKISDYRSPAYELIHSHDLAFVRTFVDALQGNARFPNGGAVIAATNKSNAPRAPSMELALSQRLAEQEKKPASEIPKSNPYLKGYDARVENSLRNVEVMKLKGVSRPEARSLLEYWAASGMLRATVDEHEVSEKMTLSGGGILGEMERTSLLTMRI
ncbi:mitochondrial ribosomal death-associated protein 3-domain-containing protein [Podospora fimiseda]|uniref:Small ribosomal subunit protein mS29 n=1 Tax=Podospora fimiseda TaxID=252190 RepID=A0AAN7BT70_9PEZI|nr:mitochondrial ribosomal death-associated protein 3-domain-containing protein [Podospora fimiseda]